MDIQQKTPTPLESALACAKRRWQVFPCHGVNDAGKCTCGRLDCEHPGKHPRTTHGVNDATRDEKIIRAWWAKWPDANLAVATGSRSGIAAADVDARNGGHERWAELEVELGPLPDTVVSLTGGGGAHHIYSVPTDAPTPTIAERHGVGLKGDGGYVIVEPSRHKSGRQYCWDLGAHPDDTLPARLVEALRGANNGSKQASTTQADERLIPRGHRQNTLFEEGCRLRRFGYSEAEILAALRALNKRCVEVTANGGPDPGKRAPLPDKTLRDIARRVPQTYAPAATRYRLVTFSLSLSCAICAPQ